jgi:hypothetical protein
MIFNWKTISGALLVEALLNEGIISKTQYDKIQKLYDDWRDETHYLLLIWDDLTDVITDEQKLEAINYLRNKHFLSKEDATNVMIAI